MKSILLTGASGNIGADIIKSFYKSYKLICVDKNRSSLMKIKKKYKKIEIYNLDLTKEKEVNNFLQKISKKQKSIDILINNAGLIYNNPIIKLSKSGKFIGHSFNEWKKIIDVNLNSFFLISSKVIQNWCNKRSKGLIINISSLSAKGNVGQSAYSCAKSSIEILTKIWSHELSLFDIRVAGIAPGFFNTSSTKKALTLNQINHIKKNTPTRRLGHIKELISAIKFIINNKFFNGKTLPIDGGLNL